MPLDCDKEYAYSMTLNAQDNPNTAKKNAWKNMGNTISCSEAYGSSKYTIKSKTITAPQVLAIANFGLDIPEEAYITRVRIGVCMRIDNSSTKVKAPHARFMIYKGSGKVTQQTVAGKDGWYGATYRDYADAYISTSWKEMTYSIYEADWNKMKYPSSQLNNPEMGIDLHFETPTKMTKDTGVQVRWARIKVDYVLPNYRITYTPSRPSENNPFDVEVDNTYCITVNFENTTKANGGMQDVLIELPFGTELVSYTGESITAIDDYNYKWVVDGKGLAKESVQLCLKSHIHGVKPIISSIGDVEFPEYINPLGNKQNYGDMNVSSTLIQKGEPSCFEFDAKVMSVDDFISFDIVVDGTGQTDWTKVSNEFKEFYNNPNEGNNILTGDDGHIAWELSQDSIAQGVSIDWENTNNNRIQFIVPHNEEVNIIWTGCFIPLTVGDNFLRITNNDTHNITDYDYISADPVRERYISFYENQSKFYDHRLLTQITSGAYFLTMGVKSTDRVMIQQDCTLKAYIWKDMAYIGCVPILRPHYEPEHDTSNDGLSESYKNITYKGKTMEIEEDTSLKIKLPPRDWTTLQGLVGLDKPIPVNTVPSAFEGDVLTHRGWAEITGIKGITKTNPLYYDGEVELDYLTHNINTRFTITKGGKSFNINLPSLLASVLDSGEEFASYTYVNEDGDIVTNGTGYFDVDTDGAYIYDSSMSEESRTLVALDNKQFVRITSLEPFTEQASVTMRWHTTKIDEDRENNIDREIYLLDENGSPIFKYFYYDYEFDTNDEYYNCKVKAESLIGEEWVEQINSDLHLATDVESLQLMVDENGKVIQESEPQYDALIPDDDEEEGEIYEFNDFTYGSTLRFDLNNSKLTITDMGYNGREIYRTVDLKDGKYKLCVNFKNNNIDSDTTDVITFFDFEVAENIISSDYGLDYANTYISSFPVADKKLLFTRDSEEGTLYYFKGEDNEEFSYIQEPFYMYNCGVDLTAGDGQSIFNLNNSYSIFYMQNGLVRIGFNRLNGELYISKFDLHSREYINVAHMRCTNIDFTVGTYSDDKIQIVAGTTVYSMYRGHPYIVISHPDEDISFITTYEKIWAEKVNDDAYQFPVLFDLQNHDNLLPSSVSGEDIDINALSVSDIENEDVTIFPTLTLTALDEEIYSDIPAIFAISGTTSGFYDIVPVENGFYTGVLGNYECFEESNDVARWLNVIIPNVVQLGSNTTLSASVENYSNDSLAKQIVMFYEVYELSLQLTASKPILKANELIELSCTLYDSSDSSKVAKSGEVIRFYIEEE